jgi:hypothetical protein
MGCLDTNSCQSLVEGCWLLIPGRELSVVPKRGPWAQRQWHWPSEVIHGLGSTLQCVSQRDGWERQGSATVCMVITVISCPSVQVGRCFRDTEVGSDRDCLFPLAAITGSRSFGLTVGNVSLSTAMSWLKNLKGPRTADLF